MYKRFFHSPSGSYFLFGPRGTGKTTWLKNHHPDALWIDLLNPREERKYAMRPELLIDQVLASNKTVIIIDEVQKVPKLLDSVHLLIERRKDIQFILTGSSARKLKKEGVNLLAGRALLKYFHPFIGFELKDEFNLEKALKTGVIPLVWDSPNPEEQLQSYVDLYLQEEVKAEALVRNIGDFSRFLEVISYSHGSLLNLSNISRECEVTRKSVENHLQILKDLLLAYTLEVFQKRAKRITAKHPKFYFFDPGVFRVLRKKSFLDISTELEGAALEGLVAEHLRCWIHTQIEKHDLYFWRTRSGLEVDFILYGPTEFIAIEVKNNKTIHPRDLHGLKEFYKDYPEVTPVLIYRGKEKLKKENILCLPAKHFFTALDPSKPLKANLF